MGINVQGLVEERDLHDVAGMPFAYTIISRRSRLHPGMRYIARGLNALASPGNELECEQVRAAAFLSIIRLWHMHCSYNDLQPYDA